MNLREHNKAWIVEIVEHNIVVCSRSDNMAAIWSL